jgi:presenilin-like A22 family membrane protease
MKNNKRIIFILIALFLIIQLIGLYVVNFYLDSDNKLPYGFNETQNIEKTTSIYAQLFANLVFSFAIAVIIVYFISKINFSWLFRIWFFFVASLAMGITLNLFTSKIGILYASQISLAVGFILAFFKTFKKNIIIHNLTEILIYPGIASLFVAILNFPFTILLLILISIYDIWAVWHSKFMIKMAKFQINKARVFGGLLVTYADKKVKNKIKALKLKYNNRIPDRILKKSKLKIGMAILGGGDIVFPIIASGVFLKTFNSLAASLIVVLFSTLALCYIYFIGKKNRYYPAMPYLTAGIFLGMLIGWLVFVL